MAKRFQTVIRKARFVVTGYSAQEMLAGATALNQNIGLRMDRGLDAADSPAPALKPKYLKQKQRRGGSSLRDWRLTGRLRGSMKVLIAGPNKATLGFTDAVANLRAAVNNARARQYGVSPSDQKVLMESLHSQGKPVKAQVA